MKSKIKSLVQIKSIFRKLKRQHKTVVFTNGCFDILHAGHVAYLSRAKKMGDVLMIGLNSDRSVREIKGRNRPVNPENDRAEVLAALTAVDFIVIFNEATPRSLILAIRPDVLVKGADWKIEQIAGAKEVLSWGGKIKRVPLLKGRSTTDTLKKIRHSA